MPTEKGRFSSSGVYIKTEAKSQKPGKTDRLWGQATTCVLVQNGNWGLKTKDKSLS